MTSTMRFVPTCNIGLAFRLPEDKHHAAGLLLYRKHPALDRQNSHFMRLHALPK